MTNLQKPTWYACYTEGLNSDVSFVRTYEEAVALIDWNISDDPSLSFDNLVTPLYLHPPQQATAFELLDVLRTVLSESYDGPLHQSYRDQAKKVINKALGAN